MLHAAYGAINRKSNQNFQDEGKTHTPGHRDSCLCLRFQFLAGGEPEEDDTLDKCRYTQGRHLVKTHPVQRHGDRQQEGIRTGRKVRNFGQPHNDR